VRCIGRASYPARVRPGACADPRVHRERQRELRLERAREQSVTMRNVTTLRKLADTYPA
jgi:hypothetical protein